MNLKLEDLMPNSSDIHNMTFTSRNCGLAGFSLMSIALTIVTCCFIIVAIIFGNGLTIAVVFLEPSLREAQNWFIVSLAVADLLVGVIVMPLSLAYEVVGRWVFGSFLCEIWLAIDVLFVTSSTLNITAISLDRYWSVTNPLHYRRKLKRFPFMIAAAWIIALFISFPPLVGWRHDRSDPWSCEVSRRLDYVLFSALGSFFIPSTILICAYCRIFLVTRLRERKHCAAAAKAPPDYIRKSFSLSQEPIRSPYACFDLEKRSPDERSPAEQSRDAQSPDYRSPVLKRKPDSTISAMLTPLTTIAILCTSSWHHRDTRERMGFTRTAFSQLNVRLGSTNFVRGLSSRNNSQVAATLEENVVEFQVLKKNATDRRRLLARRRELRATAILGGIIFGFILCWLPFFTVYILNAVCCRAPELMFDIFFWLGYCNSALNPLIYAVGNIEFRTAFQRLLRLR